MHSILALAALLVPSSPTLEGPYVEGKLSVYVVRGPETDSRPYLTLDEGLASGKVRVREKESGGEVNSLEVENGSDRFLFLHVGDVIRGGKQDRTIATDVVLPPRSGRVAIDAFCVEQGRWSADPRTAMSFSANEALVSGAALKRSIQSDRSQHEVWARVAETEARVAAYAETPTASLSESGTYSAVVGNETLRAERESGLRTLLSRVAAHEDAVGIVAVVGGEVVGADVYGSRALFRKLARKLLDAYLQEAILSQAPEGSTSPSKAEVERFLDSGEEVRTESLSTSMERRVSDNAAADVFEYRVRGDQKPVHASYVRKK